MSDGLNMLERRIEEFKQALEDMKTSTSEAHSVLKQIRQERREVERLLSTPEIRKLVHDAVSKVVQEELEKLAPELREQSNHIYNKVSKEVDRLLNLSLGKVLSEKRGEEDLRPILAEKFRQWMREIIEQDESERKGGVQ